MRSPGGGRGSLCHRPPSPAPQASRASVLKGAMRAATPHLQEAFSAQGSWYPQGSSASRCSNPRLLFQYARVPLSRPAWTGPVVGFSPSLSLCSHENALLECASPALVRPGIRVMESRGRKGPYLQHLRLSSPRPLEVEVQLSTLREKLLGDVVCLRSLIPGTRGAGLQTHWCALQGGAAPRYL